MSSIHHNSNVLITGGNFNAFTDPPQELNSQAFKDLYARIAVGALHNSAERHDPPKCHPRTRLKILEKIIAWAKDIERQSPIIWLDGPAGAGKSAIAQMIAELLQSQGDLLASFFFSRVSPGRNDKNRLIATLAYQLALSIPTTRQYIEDVIRKDPATLDKSMEVQYERLIVKPLRRTAASLSPNPPAKPAPCVIIIDGLDECRGAEDQQEILELLSNLARRTDGFPIAILIASRPETYLRERIDNHYRLISRITLNESFSPDDDIRLFLVEQFDSMKRKHPNRRLIVNRESWPSKFTIDKLVTKSSGQFIYAATVVKYVSSLHFRPDERLDIILGLAPVGKQNPYGQLDAIYQHIFAEAHEVTTALRIISLRLTGDEIINFRSDNATDLDEINKFIEHFLGVPSGRIHHCLADFQSILAFNEGQNIIHFFHASMPDYLLDESRSGRFFVNLRKANADLAICYLNYFSQNGKPTTTPAMSALWRKRSPGGVSVRDALWKHMLDAEATPELLAALRKWPFYSNKYRNLFSTEVPDYDSRFRRTTEHIADRVVLKPAGHFSARVGFWVYKWRALVKTFMASSS